MNQKSVDKLAQIASAVNNGEKDIVQALVEAHSLGILDMSSNVLNALKECEN